MISSSLKAVTHVVGRNFWRLRIINNNLIRPNYFKSIRVSKRFYYNTPGQSINTKNFSETRDNKDENIDSQGNPIEKNSTSNPTIQTDGRAKNDQQKTTNFHDLTYNEKLKKVYHKQPYGNEGEPNTKQKHNSDPMSVMYSNLAKDEDLNAKDNHISDDDKQRNLSKQSTLEQMTETTFGMPASQSDVISTSNKSRVTSDIYNQQNLSEQQNKLKKQFGQNKDRNPNDSSTNNVFHNANQDENFHNTYVGDVEYKIPSQNFSDSNIKNQKQNEMDYQKPIQSQNSSSTQSNLSSSNTMNKGNNNNDIGMKNPNDKHHEQLKKNATSSTTDLDLSTKSFQKKMEEYKQNAPNESNEDKPYSKNEDYFLKDNNSEYNNYISNQPDTDFVEEDNLNNYNKTTDKDEEEVPDKDNNMYHGKGHSFPNH